MVSRNVSGPGQIPGLKQGGPCFHGALLKLTGDTYIVKQVA